VNKINFEKLVGELPEGVVIMDDGRKITYINQKAHQMTGWKTGEIVPYCSYCQLRQVSDHEEKCILANDNPLPSFRSHMPNYVDADTDFEMSMSKIEFGGTPYKILMIRNPSLNNQEEKVKTQELLIHETMLAQENERKRIARELHDHIGQSVYSIYLGLDGIKRHVENKEYHKRLEKMNVVMEETLKSLKNLTKQLHPRLFDHLGFKTALKSSVEDWMQLYKIEISLDIQLPEELRFENEEGLHLYRIIQEAVNNAVRHGKATSIIIEVSNAQNEVYFQITDNGRGFNVQNVKENGVGLKHMKERVKMLNGDVKYFSQIGGPTRIEGYITIKER
jgi:signal transduction histidine kinase